MTHVQYDLPKPPKLSKDTLRVIPLGGLGEVGRNMTVYELNGKLLIVDCGVLFPEDTQPGVDLILPDLNYVLDRLDDVIVGDGRREILQLAVHAHGDDGTIGEQGEAVALVCTRLGDV